MGEVTARYGIVTVIGNDQRTNLITEVIQKLEKEKMGLQFAINSPAYRGNQNFNEWIIKSTEGI